MRMMGGGGGGGLYDTDDNDSMPEIRSTSNQKRNEKTEDYENQQVFDGDDTFGFAEAEVGEDNMATLLKRASSVHAALLLSLPSTLSTLLMANSNNNINNQCHGSGDDILFDGRVMTKELVDAIILLSDEQGVDADDDDKAKRELVNMLSFFINRHQVNTTSSSSSSPRGSCWNKETIHLTSSLLAVQFLLCLNGITIRRKQRQEPTPQNTPTDRGWGDGAMTIIILPLIFGNMTPKRAMGIGESRTETSLLLTNDVLRNAVLDLIPFSCWGDDNTTTEAVNVCLDIVEHAIITSSSTTSSSTPSATTPSSVSSPSLRQKIIVVTCQIFVRMHHGVVVNKRNKHKAVVVAAADGIIHNAMHRTVVMILRQISNDCGSCSSSGCNTSSDDERLSPESLLRPITGLLLPTLYGQEPIIHQDHQNKAGAEMLWNEILLLLEKEYNSNDDGSDDAGNEDKRRLRRNSWYVHSCCSQLKSSSYRLSFSHQCDNNIYFRCFTRICAPCRTPMTVTALLCILLPTFREMELPSTRVVVSSDMRTIKYCRPIFQPCVWQLIRDCLGRCGGSGSMTEANAVDGGGATSGGRGLSLLSRSNNNDDGVVVDQLLRRRSAHALRLMLEYERDRLIKCKNDTRSKAKKDKRGQSQQKNGDIGDGASLLRTVDMWTKYVICFEMLEMEIELHLVEQVWATIKEITSEVAVIDDAGLGFGYNTTEGSTVHLPRLQWEDIGSLLSRVLLSDAPTMRKLGLYRFLSGHTGVDVAAVLTVSDADKPGKLKKNVGVQKNVDSAPLSVVSVDFVLDVVLRAYDSIVGTKVGINMNIDEGGQQERVSMSDLLSVFLSNYTVTLAKEIENETIGSARLSEFVNRVFGSELIQIHKARSLVLYYRSVASALDTIVSSGNKLLNTVPENILANIRSMRTIFSSGGAPKSMQDGLKLDFALMLKSSIPWKTVDASAVLKVFALYPPPEVSTDEPIECPSSVSRDALRAWLLGLGDGKWAQNASPACASAFVSGQLLPFVDTGTMSGISSAERETGMSICTLCALSGNGSESLWPAVFKGLKIVSTTDSTTPGFCMASRSMILLEYGCKEGVLSGMGNGDLLLDSSKEFMMPPPPQIESLLGNAVKFIMSQLTSMSTNLFQIHASETSGGSTRSSSSNSANQYVAVLIGQLRVLHLSFPSSVSLSQAVNDMLSDCVHQLTDIESAQTNNSTSEISTHVVKLLTLSYAALSCGASFTGDSKLSRLISTCQTILNVELSTPPGIKNDAKQAARSIFQYSKW
jgi:hypothetical protein